MSKWKCEICGSEFDNFYAQGFNNKIYCPLCFFKEENRELNNKVELQATTLKEKDEMLNNRNGVIQTLNLRINKAIELAYQYAQIDGNHHKMWVIDQMVRELLEKNYDKWVKDYEDDGEYSWDTGINP